MAIQNATQSLILYVKKLTLHRMIYLSKLTWPSWKVRDVLSHNGLVMDIVMTSQIYRNVIMMVMIAVWRK
jgi:hypothetical protein